MLVRHRKKFIYTKTRKTAGTSVEVYFEPLCVADGTWVYAHYRPEEVSEFGIIGRRGPTGKGDTFWNHMSAKEIRDNVGTDVWDSYFKFCVVRDPYDKLVSLFHWRKTEHEKRPLQSKLKDGLKKVLGRGDLMGRVEGDSMVDRFRDWLAKGGGVADQNTYMLDGEVCVDHFIQYEDLSGGVAAVCDRLDVPFEAERIPRLKAGRRPSDLQLSDYYDQPTIDLVRARYGFEIEKFGYQPPC